MSVSLSIIVWICKLIVKATHSYLMVTVSWNLRMELQRLLEARIKVSCQPMWNLTWSLDWEDLLPARLWLLISCFLMIVRLSLEFLIVIWRHLSVPCRLSVFNMPNLPHLTSERFLLAEWSRCHVQCVSILHGHKAVSNTVIWPMVFKPESYYKVFMPGGEHPLGAFLTAIFSEVLHIHHFSSS